MNSGVKLSMAIPDSCPQLFWAHEMEKMHWTALRGLQYHSGWRGIAASFLQPGREGQADSPRLRVQKPPVQGLGLEPAK